jgi:hypothetical protein
MKQIKVNPELQRGRKLELFIDSELTLFLNANKHFPSQPILKS